MAKAKAKKSDAQASGNAGDVDELNERIQDIGNILPLENGQPKYKRSDVVFDRVIACDGEDFACGELENGKFAAVWPGHVDVVETEDELKEMLNSHEKQLHEFGVKR